MSLDLKIFVDFVYLINNYSDASKIQFAVSCPRNYLQTVFGINFIVSFYLYRS